MANRNVESKKSAFLHKLLQHPHVLNRRARVHGISIYAHTFNDNLDKIPQCARQKIFGHTHQQNMLTSFVWHRKRIAANLQNPRIAQITFHTFPHWKATMEYRRTKDLIHVQRLLGHRNITNTMRYTQLVRFENGEYHSSVAKTIDEARQLIENGFEYITDMDGVKLFRKRK